MLATYAAELMKQKMDAMYEASGDQALSDQITYLIRSSAQWMWRRKRSFTSPMHTRSHGFHGWANDGLAKKQKEMH